MDRVKEDIMVKEKKRTRTICLRWV